MVLEQIANLSVVNSAYGFKSRPLRFAMSPVGRGGGLENLLTVMVLGFESLSWRVVGSLPTDLSVAKHLKENDNAGIWSNVCSKRLC